MSSSMKHIELHTTKGLQMLSNDDMMDTNGGMILIRKPEVSIIRKKSEDFFYQGNMLLNQMVNIFSR